MAFSKFLSKQVTEIKPSGIRRFFDLAAEMDDVLSLSIGEPDFPTPLPFCEAAAKACAAGDTHYSANYGMIELRQEISKYQKDLIGVEYDPKTEILVTVGGSEAVDITCRACLEPGDEFLIPEPAFVAYAPCALLQNAVPVAIPTTIEEGFKLTADKLRQYITPKTKMLLINSPCNPTGAVMDKESLEEVAKLCIEHDLLVISDEIYAELIYGTKHYSIAACPGMRERTVVISGASKAFAMTGWRLGYLAAPVELLSGIAKIHQFALMCSPTPSQHAALEAFKNGREEVDKMVHEYARRREVIVRGLREMGLEICEPQGAFYAFPSIKSTGLSDEEFCERLLQEEHVAVVPGSAFGESGRGFIRISYAASMDTIHQALEKMAHFVASLKQ